MPMFCPPTANWCVYQSNGGPVWSKVKPLCCKSFASSLGNKCGTTQPASGADSSPAPVAQASNNGIPATSISQALNLKINAFNFVAYEDTFQNTVAVTNVNPGDHYAVVGSKYEAPVTFGNPSMILI